MDEQNVLVCAFDISEEKEQSKAFARVIQHFGNLDVLVNNAGRIYFSEFVDDSMDDDMKTFKVNTFANVNISRIVLRHWNETGQRNGQIVATSSLAAYVNMPYMQIYGASKRSLHEYYNALRMEYAAKPISFTIVVPGPVESELYKKSFLSNDKKLDQARSVDSFTMTTDRCVDLMLVGIAYRLKEIWVSKNPILIFAYFYCFSPFWTNSLWSLLFMNEKTKRFFKSRIIKSQ